MTSLQWFCVNSVVACWWGAWCSWMFPEIWVMYPVFWTAGTLTGYLLAK